MTYWSTRLSVAMGLLHNVYERLPNDAPAKGLAWAVLARYAVLARRHGAPAASTDTELRSAVVGAEAMPVIIDEVARIADEADTDSPARAIAHALSDYLADYAVGVASRIGRETPPRLAVGACYQTENGFKVGPLRRSPIYGRTTYEAHYLSDWGRWDENGLSFLASHPKIVAEWADDDAP